MSAGGTCLAGTAIVSTTVCELFSAGRATSLRTSLYGQTGFFGVRVGVACPFVPFAGAATLPCATGLFDVGREGRAVELSANDVRTFCRPPPGPLARTTPASAVARCCTGPGDRP